MAKLYLTDIDLNKNQLLNAVIQVLASAPGTPSDGQIYYDSGDETFYGWNGSMWVDLGNQTGATNLTFSRDGTTVTVISSTGDNAQLPAATTSLAGVMTSTDKTKLDGIENGAEVNTVDSVNGQTGTVDLDADDIDDTSTINKFTTTAEINKLSGIEPNADVTDAANVNAAGATMNNDTSLAGNNYFLDEDNMASNDATKTVSQQSLVAYVGTEISNAITSGMNFKGSYNASTNSPNLDVLPIATEIGDTYVVSVGGNFFSEDVQAGDMIIAKQNSPTTLAHWVVVNKNIPDIVDASTTAKGIIELATQTEVNTGTDTTRAVTPSTLKGNLGTTATLNNAVRYTQTIGNGSLTNITVTHNIGRQFLTAQIFQTTTPFAQVECDIEVDSINVTSFTFNTAPTTNQYTVVITG